MDLIFISRYVIWFIADEADTGSQMYCGRSFYWHRYWSLNQTLPIWAMTLRRLQNYRSHFFRFWTNYSRNKAQLRSFYVKQMSLSSIKSPKLVSMQPWYVLMYMMYLVYVHINSLYFIFLKGRITWVCLARPAQSAGTKTSHSRQKFPLSRTFAG